MSLTIGPKLPAVEETSRSGLEPPPNSPVSVHERFAAAVAELPESSRAGLMAYGEGELEFRVDDAIRDGNMEALKLLLDSGVKPTAMMLRFAIYKDKREAVALLLERGADPNGLWEHKHNLEKILPYMEFLLSHGADKAEFTKQYGSKINKLLENACVDADVDRVKTLVICGADVNQVKDGVPLVHVTWMTNHNVYTMEQKTDLIKAQTAIIRLLCKHGADPAKGIHGKHPLSYMHKAYNEVTACLLGQGMIKDYSTHGRAPLNEVVARLVLQQVSVATEQRKGKLFHDCVLALVPLLTCMIEDVSDECAAALAKAMLEYDWVVPDETHELAHEALRQYLERLDRYPLMDVRRYAAKYNFSDLLMAGERVLWAAGLTPDSSHSGEFKLTGDFSIRRHGMLLLEYARIWASNPAVPPDHAEAILRFVVDRMGVLDPDDESDLHLITTLNGAIESVRIDAARFHPEPGFADPLGPDQAPL